MLRPPVSESQPPPSGQIPGKPRNSGLYIAGIAVLCALMGGLLYWRFRPEPAPSAPTPTAATTAQPAPAEPPPVFAPPPPPPPEEVADAGATAAKPSGSGVGAAGKGPCGGRCGDGEPSSALTSAVNGAAQSARGCYNRALRTAEVSGRMVVSIQVGSTGAVCSASIAEDSVQSSEISSCVLGRFRGKSFPPPTSGCVVVNVPINFTIKQ